MRSHVPGWSTVSRMLNQYRPCVVTLTSAHSCYKHINTHCGQSPWQVWLKSRGNVVTTTMTTAGQRQSGSGETPNAIQPSRHKWYRKTYWVHVATKAVLVVLVVVVGCASWTEDKRECCDVFLKHATCLQVPKHLRADSVENRCAKVTHGGEVSWFRSNLITAR